MKYLEHKGYTGSIEYSKEDGLLYGKVLGIRGLISYEGATGLKLETDFVDAIDTYLADCRMNGITPEKPFKGSFNVRISSMLHRKAALMALEERTSLNNFVAESIRERIIKESGDQKKVLRKRNQAIARAGKRKGHLPMFRRCPVMSGTLERSSNHLRDRKWVPILIFR